MRRTLVLGLDGATFRVITPLIGAGHMPNLQRLRKKGVSGPLASTMPPVTGPAWLSLATGLSPGSTGVYDFIYRRSDSEGYDFEYVDSGMYEGRAVWDRLGDAGVEVGVVDYPTFTPPYAVNGFVVAGGLGTDRLKTYPESLTATFDGLQSVESHFDIQDERYEDLERFMDDLEANLDARFCRTEKVLREADWRFCWAVIQETDWLQHVTWHCLADHPSAPEATPEMKDRVRSFWERIDEIVGRCRDIVGENGNVIVQSDHGFGPMYDRSVRLNTWLLKEGYLEAKSGGESRFWLEKRLWNLVSTIASAIDLEQFAPRLFRWGKNELSSMAIELNSIDLDRTTVFDPGHIQSMGGLYVNDTVVTNEARRDALVTEIREKLEALCSDHDIPIETYTPTELYGKRAPGSPNLIVRTSGYNVENSGWNRPVIDDSPERLANQTGSHRRDGILLAAGPDIANATVEDAAIWDVAPTLLHLFDCDVPRHLDGRVLEDALTVDRDVSYVRTQNGAESGATIDHDDRAAMREQLSDLGYFE